MEPISLRCTYDTESLSDNEKDEMTTEEFLSVVRPQVFGPIR